MSDLLIQRPTLKPGTVLPDGATPVNSLVLKVKALLILRGVGIIPPMGANRTLAGVAYLDQRFSVRGLPDLLHTGSGQVIMLVFSPRALKRSMRSAWSSPQYFIAKIPTIGSLRRSRRHGGSRRDCHLNLPPVSFTRRSSSRTSFSVQLHHCINAP